MDKILKMKKLAILRGGQCLSSEYLTSNTNYDWQCVDNHQWKATWKNIQKGTWCPVCFSSIGEKMCRYVLESLTGKKFIKNKKILGWRFELDGYNEELNLGFEFQGRQHFEFVRRFHRTELGFEKQKYRDIFKKKRIKDIGIKLIEIHYSQVESYKKIEKYIKKKLILLKIEIVNVQIDWDRLFIESSKIQEGKRIAVLKGGDFISTVYIGSHKKYKWQCREKHIWKANYSSVKAGSWCPECAGMEVCLSDLQEYALTKEGMCLANIYIDNRTKVKWQCKEKHIWEADWSNIKSGKWCPICVGRKNIEDLRVFALEKGGLLISETYTNAKLKYRWQCRENHIWEESWNKVRQNWCLECSGKKTIIQDLKSFAENKRGRCLSEQYINVSTHYVWQCDKKHVWDAVWYSIRSGSWCPYCYGRYVYLFDLQEFVKKHDGKCLSDTYIKAKTKYIWQCKNHHVWEDTWSNIKSGRWCTRCE